LNRKERKDRKGIKERRKKQDELFLLPRISRGSDEFSWKNIKTKPNQLLVRSIKMPVFEIPAPLSVEKPA
jgi:hypothetical protein